MAKVLTPEESGWPPPVGVYVKVGQHLYARCAGCGKVLKVTGFFGSLHFCTGEDK